MSISEYPLEPELISHIYNRANGNEKLYLNENHYYEFMYKYTKYIEPIVDTYAYCLLPNHFHFMVKIKSEEEIISFFKKQNPMFSLPEGQGLSGSLSRQFGRLFSSYTQWFNGKIDRKGSLFIPNFKRKPVEDPHYFTQLVAYIHTNPIKHGLTDDLHKWTFSSYHAYTSLKKSKVNTNIILDFFGSRDELEKFHKNYNEYLMDLKGLELE